ncbi:hypothetical protein SVAN01_05372 [Stagonosporopsis vannaccii]|nr:hypothetical protein SVAN01_05372 [Stagonosporopsis vannaccii]
MVNSLFFRWEDCQALQHHCGFCGRPLSRPGARASCFVTHSEPCHRFHQAMFMRNRAHMCNYCHAIDEAHYKRHHDLVAQLRSVYESSGEVHWTIVPGERGDPRRGQLFVSPPTTCDALAESLASDETPTSRRERKDAKCLARASNRARVVTQEEIRYIDSVLHSAESVTGAEGDSPANLEEMQLIEEHLRYNANVYTNRSSHCNLRRFATIPDVDVDFESEMERVLNTFRITELVKRNFKNRGLQGKELRKFDTLVETFKDAVVEDLVLVKKDMMEIRMRRAAYLRYTNKTAYEIVEERYTERDWRTGARITSSSSELSGLTSQAKEAITPQDLYPSCQPSANYLAPNSPDRRHLHHVHTRISGDDGLDQTTIEPYHTPLLPLIPNSPLKKPVVLQLKIVENKENGFAPAMTNRGWLRRGVARQKSTRPLQTAEEADLAVLPLSTKLAIPNEAEAVTKPVWGKSKPMPEGHMNEHSGLDNTVFPALIPRVNTTKSLSFLSKARAVQPLPDDEILSLNGAECAITTDRDDQDAHPVVSQKMVKKAQRKAEHKAKKINKLEAMPSPIMVNGPSLESVEQGSDLSLLGSAACDGFSHVMKGLPSQGAVNSPRELVDDAQVHAPIRDAVEGDADLVTSISPSLPSLQSIQHTAHGRHEHWMRFSRFFAVDQLTIPLLQPAEGGSHGSSCLFERHGVSDCPFHEPHCSCGDPLMNQCYLVYPSKQFCTFGPHNQACGERLLALYERHDLTKGRVMLVDEDLVPYFVNDSTSTIAPDFGSMPPRLLREHYEYLDGFDRGPLMKQELEFKRLFQKNTSMKHPLTLKKLQDVQHQKFDPQGSVQLCYCQIKIARTASAINKEFSKGYVSCSYQSCEFGGIFHKRCVKKLGVEKVSRWYCTACEKQMKALACRALGIQCMDEVAITRSAEKDVAPWKCLRGLLR